MAAATPPGSVSPATKRRPAARGACPAWAARPGSSAVPPPRATRSIAGVSAPAALTRVPTAAARTSRPVGRGPRTSSAAWAGWSASPAIRTRAKSAPSEVGSGEDADGSASVPPRPVRTAAAAEVQANLAVAWPTRRPNAASAGRCASSATTPVSATPKGSASARGAVRGVRPAMPRPDNASRWSARRQPISVMPRERCDLGTGECSYPTVAHGTPCIRWQSLVYQRPVLHRGPRGGPRGLLPDHADHEWGVYGMFQRLSDLRRLHRWQPQFPVCE